MSDILDVDLLDNITEKISKFLKERNIENNM
jgi:hypothetical protein